MRLLSMNITLIKKLEEVSKHLKVYQLINKEGYNWYVINDLKNKLQDIIDTLQSLQSD